KRGREDHEAPPAPKGRGPQQQNASGPSVHVVTSLPPSSPPRHPSVPSPSHGLVITRGTFSYEVLASATSGFSEANLLGRGEYGYVYKGILSHRIEIAVKLMKAGSAQGDREFQSEINIISRVHHEHLVALVGYCVTDSHRLLVYEFIPNKTLEFHLHGKGRPPMKWSSRYKIAVGSAKGLSYLHQTSLFHQIANFGLAKISPETETHVATRLMGTFGYLAPEYVATGMLTDKCDVYSFGTVLLELITGRHPINANNDYGDDSFIDWARSLLLRAIKEDNFEVIVDKNLNEYDREEMGRMIETAGACVRYAAGRRPRMSQVI
ncbi:unnamed protein product, partial [Eruca vesicaria subsp. sativa]|nr:unnamed protein product [Eruca vesicaria subsp. sativa]